MNLPDLATTALGVLRAVGPVIAGLAVLGILLQLVTRSGRARLRLASRGLSATPAGVARRLLAGTLVPLLGIAALTVSISLEKEVREGPNRMIDRLQHGADDTNLAWVMQAGTGHFMDTSTLPTVVTTAALADPSRYQVLWEQLTFVERDGHAPDTGLVLGLDGDRSTLLAPQVTADSPCTQSGGRCTLTPGQAVADTDRYPFGTQLRVRGHGLTVVGHTREPYSLINRSVIFTDTTAFTNTTGTVDPAYAVLSAGAAGPTNARALAATGVPGSVQVLSPTDLQRENARFWAGNGTPLLLLMIILSATFCGVALYAARRAVQQREHVALGTLQALGLRPGQAAGIDLLRALIATTLATVAAWPLAYLIVSATNSGMIGFHAPVEPLMVVAAAGLIVVTNTLGTVVLWARLRRASVIESLTA